MKKPIKKAKAKTSATKKSPRKKVNKKGDLPDIDFKKLRKEAEAAQKKIAPEIPKPKISKPKFRRVRVYDNGVEMYMSDNRKVSIALEEDGNFLIETKKILKKDEQFSAFSPAKIKYLKKWGLKAASCQLNISRDALIAIGMGISELLRNGALGDKEIKQG